MTAENKTSLLNTLKTHSILIGILLLAVILRCYDLFSIPYTHDELSGLLRTRFDSFGELIAKGVQIDGHPAFVQVFLYYWTAVFGTDEWIVKLPFILSGVGAVWFSYKIGKRWSNVTTGLIVAAIIATSQYPVMYSQIARPYTTGFFFTVWMAYHWGEIVFFKNYDRKHLVFFPIAAALCAYNHHFSMLTAGLIGLSGYFFVYKTLFRKYTLLCAAAIALYAPHFPILAAQLKMGGLDGWLGKPEPSFFTHYIRYISQYSLVILVMYGCIIVWTRIAGQKSRASTKAIVFSGVLFAAVSLTGYVYSIQVAPVLQSSVLIFVYPFLLIFAFGWANEQSRMNNTAIVSVIILLNCFTLIFQRKHYTVFYKSPFDQLVIDANEATQQDPKTLTIIFSDEPKTRFYEEKGEISIPDSYLFITYPEFTERDLETLLAERYTECDRICLGATSGLPANYRAIILQKYPEIIWQRSYFSAETILVQKGKPGNRAIVSLKKDQHVFTGFRPEKWSNDTYYFAQDDEWGPGFSRPVADLILTPSDIVDVVVKIRLSDLKQDPLLTVVVQTQDSVIQYLGNAVSQKLIDPNDSTVTLIQSVKFIDSPYQKFKDPFLNTYIWNRDKKPLRLLSFEVFRRDGNPYQYGLFEEIP